MREKVEFRYSSDDSDLEPLEEIVRMPNGLPKGKAGQYDLYEIERQTRATHVATKEVNTNRFYEFISNCNNNVVKTP